MPPSDSLSLSYFIIFLSLVIGSDNNHITFISSLLLFKKLDLIGCIDLIKNSSTI